MASIFTKIIQGDIPCYKILEDADFIAFLDISPVALGHTLVVPKMEVDNIFDLPEEILTKYLITSKRVAKALEIVVPCNRIGISVIGLEVPHAHMHLIPISELNDMDFAKPRVKITAEKMAQLAKSIASEIK